MLQCMHYDVRGKESIIHAYRNWPILLSNHWGNSNATLKEIYYLLLFPHLAFMWILIYTLGKHDISVEMHGNNKSQSPLFHLKISAISEPRSWSEWTSLRHRAKLYGLTHLLFHGDEQDTGLCRRLVWNPWSFSTMEWFVVWSEKNNTIFRNQHNFTWWRF